MSQSVRAASRSSHHSNAAASSRLATLTPSQRKLEQRLAKLRREEAERKADAEVALARQKADFARQQVDLQADLDIRIAEENQRQIVAEARIEEAIYESGDESDWGSVQPRPLFASLLGSNEARTNEWVRTGGSEPRRTSAEANSATGMEVNPPQPVSCLPVIIPPTLPSIRPTATEAGSPIGPIFPPNVTSFPQTTSFFIPWANPVEHEPPTSTLTNPQTSNSELLENSNHVHSTQGITAVVPNFQLPINQQPVVTSLTSQFRSTLVGPTTHGAPIFSTPQFCLNSAPVQARPHVPSTNVNVVELLSTRPPASRVLPFF